MSEKAPWDEDWGTEEDKAPWDMDWGSTSGPSSVPTREIGAGEGGARALTQGLTFGFSDEVGAGVAALTAHLAGKAEEDTFAETYTKMMGSLEKQRTGFRESNPFVSYGAEAVGGIATGVAGGARFVGGKAYELASNWGKLLRLSGVGAVEGGLYGAGSSKPGERAEGAVMGAGTGAVSSTIGAGLTNAAGKVVAQAMRYGKRKLTDTATKKARRAVVQAAEDEGLTTNEILEVLDELGPNGALIDVGDSFRTLGRVAMDVGGTAKTQARKFVNNRQAGQQDRLEYAIDKISGAKAKDYRGTLREVVRMRREVAKPMYREAKEVGLFPRGNLARVMENPLMKQSLKRGKTWAKAEASSLKRIGNNEFSPGQGIFDQIHYAKMHLDDRIGSAIRQGKGSESRILMNVKNDLMQAIREQNPAYIRANDAFSSDSGLKNALEYGYDRFLKESPEVMEETLASMSSSEREMWKLGAVKAVSNMMGKVQLNSNAAKKLFGTKEMRQRMGMIFDNPMEFERQIAREAEYSKTLAALTGGPNTAERIAARQSLESTVDPTIMGAIIAQEPTSALALAGRALSQKADPQTASEIGQILLSQGTSKQEIIRLFNQPMIKEALGDQYNAVVAPIVRAAAAPAVMSAQ